MRTAIGEIVAGRYRLERQLGEGGMGAVWAATHTVTGKAVALKFLLGRGDDPQMRARLLREARAVCSVQHPHVVPVHDVLELEGGAPALVMDLLAGESLRAKLDREGKLPHEEVVRIAIDVLSALEAAHAQGIVHRDLKPDNIFLARAPGSASAKNEDVKVLDFGIAKVTTLGEADAEAAALTRTDAMVGTPYYMAPEQVYGEKDIDGRSDLWSMGIVMYECLAGVLPTEGTNLGQIFKLVTIGPIPPITEKAPQAPPALAKLVTWCLERDRSARPPSATALRDALERVRAGSTMDGAEVAVRAVDAVPTRAPRRWGAIAAAVLALAAVGGTTAFATKGPTLATSPPVPVPVPVPSSAPASAPASASASASAPASAPASAKPKLPARGKPNAPPPPSPAGAAAPASTGATKDERGAGKVVVTPPF